jgi:hypothetical protein
MPQDAGANISQSNGGPMTGKTVTIDLTEPFPLGHGGPVRKVVLREPRAKDLFEFGEPISYAQKSDGTMFSAENIEVVKLYVERLMVEPDVLIFDQVNFADAFAVKDAVLRFFSEARLARSKGGLGSSSTTSR